MSRDSVEQWSVMPIAMSWSHTTPPSIVSRTAMADKYREVFQILADRENKRARSGRARSDSIGGPERAVNYSVQNSFKYERSNRYSNILSYDKTSVKVRGKGYLNANIVVARNGHWWVAAQVSRVTSIDDEADYRHLYRTTSGHISLLCTMAMPRVIPKYQRDTERRIIKR
jgi:protein tyrosine phosphatase